MILSQAKEENFYKLIQIEDKKEIKMKLIAMGLSPGSIVTVVKNDFSGPLIIGINSSRISLGRSLANKIEVSLYEKTN